MDVSANITSPISNTRYISASPSGATGAGPAPASDADGPDTPATAGVPSAANAPPPLSAALIDAPAPSPSAVIADLAQLPANIRYAPSDPPHGQAVAHVDIRA